MYNSPTTQLTLLQAPKTLPKTKIPHRIERKITKPIPDIELLLLPSEPSQIRYERRHVSLDNRLLIHQRLHGERVTERASLARMIGIVNSVLHGRRGPDLHGSRVNGRLAHVLVALAETVDVLVGLRCVECEFVGAETEYGACLSCECFLLLGCTLSYHISRV